MNIDQQAFEAFRQEVRDGFSNIQQRLKSHDKRFISIDKRFDSIDKRFISVDKRFDSVDKRIDTLHSEISFVNRSLNKVEDRLLSLEAKVEADRQEKLSSYGSIINYFRILENVDDALEKRIAKLESR